MKPDGSMDQEAKSVPKLLYKFRRWRDTKGKAYENDQLILTSRAVWFASPADFNDPFDCRIPYRFDLMSREEQLTREITILLRDHPSWDARQLNSEAEKQVSMKSYYSKDPNVAEMGQKEYFREIAAHYGVLSFAGNCDSILMWSHYADSHRGFCVEVNAEALVLQFYMLSITDKEFIYPNQVRYYERDIPKVIPSNDDEEDLERHQSLLRTKSKDWAYEEEYRFIYAGEARLSRGINRDIVKRVIFGCQMPLQHREEIAELVRTKLPKAELCEAVRSNDRFELDFRPWNPEDK